MNRIRLGLLGTAALALAALPAPAQQKPPQHEHHDHAAMQAEKGAAQQMAPGHRHQGPHIRLSAERPRTPEDEKRADALVHTLRGSLEKYRDYRVAIADGYQPFLPELSLPEHHFTNYRLGFLNAFWFDAARPTSLLYKKIPGGWELTGAMYTAPRPASEERLDARVPLGVARWHLHVNVCLPPTERAYAADWTKFGPAGTIATEDACREVNGRWMPNLFGWMVHVYPWETEPDKIWAR